MTKSLVLLRHAKSSWKQTDSKDIDRPLSRRGERAAGVVGLFLRQESVVPDLVLCSAARRTWQTWRAIRPFLPPGIASEREMMIYEAPVKRLLATFAATADNVETLLVIGHNPGFQLATLSLCQEQKTPEMARVREKFPTAALAFIDLGIASWRELAPGTGTLRRFVSPKDLV